ncbi:1670_t:CDS:2 [Diversispora eburnea]|uniref:1670_t:CDS:1 n=1 Tax=Diversispora eburnea TaxID=1213867 RepID=A0A9N9FCA8_9GLOM|nr:1670_t:CDS:2 [Diversispora eburnea]
MSKEERVKLPRRRHSFMSDPDLGGEAMSHLSGECFPWCILSWRRHSFMSAPDLGGEVMSQRFSSAIPN